MTVESESVGAAGASNQPAVAAVLGARIDGSAGVDSNRDLLMTILGELLLPNGYAAWTQTVLSVMQSLGVRDGSARQAMARLHERGWLDRERVGRQTRWHLTDSSVEMLEAGASRIYSFGTEKRDWDGRWLVLLASVPERDRNLRYRMANGLTWAGFGALGQGTWISPWVAHESTAISLLNELGVEATMFRSELGDLGSAASLVEQAWDLPELDTAYTTFLDDTASITPGAHGSDAAASLVMLVHRWRRFPFLDPDLPKAVLPSDWPGTIAAQRFAACRALLQPAATSWWRKADSWHAPTGSSL